MKYVALILFLVVSVYAMSQERAIVYGKVTDEKGKALELVNVAISGLPGGTMTDRRGKYELEVPANIEVYVSMSFIGLEKEVERVFLQPGERFEVNKTLKSTYTELPQIEVEDKQLRSTSMVRIDPKAALNVPTSTDKISTLLITLPGVSSRNDLSSQYSVRGGNFDENLIYVNDIEIYRPFLIRSGQQEGLSFVNSDLVSSLLFSAGGFDAKYGDKMSSVLDLKYKKPNKFGGSAAVSLLGASAHVEGLITKKFNYLLGVRYKTTQYLLKGLDTEGDYKPRFLDVQTSLNYEISKKVEISFLGIYANNKYNFEPQSRETDYGTIQDPRRLTVYFEGQEIDHFENYLGGLTLTYKPNNQTRLKLIASGYNSVESESFDVIGQYWIGRVDTDFGSENFGDVTEVLGVGTQMNHARNQMDINVFNFGHKGTKEMKNQLLKWGVRYQHEQIDDHMNEWILIDSAGYSLPRPPDTPGIIDTLVNPFDLYELIKTNNTIGSNRYTAFIQNTFGVADSSRYSLTLGVRANYWDYNNQLVIEPQDDFLI